MTGLGPRAVVWFIAVLLLRVACETTNVFCSCIEWVPCPIADSVHVWF